MAPDEFAFVLLFDVGRETGFVGAVVDDDEVGGCGARGQRKSRGIEGAGHDGGGGAVESDAVVGEATGIVAKNYSKEVGRDCRRR